MRLVFHINPEPPKKQTLFNRPTETMTFRVSRCITFSSSPSGLASLVMVSIQYTTIYNKSLPPHHPSPHHPTSSGNSTINICVSHTGLGGHFFLCRADPSSSTFGETKMLQLDIPHRYTMFARRYITLLLFRKSLSFSGHSYVKKNVRILTYFKGQRKCFSISYHHWGFSKYMWMASSVSQVTMMASLH